MDVEWLFLADGAEVVNNKLYLIGGGWETLTVNAAFPIEQVCALVAAFRVPGDETDRQHAVEIEIADERGAVLLRMPGQIEVGRPPAMRPAHAQRVQMHARLRLSLERPGTYDIVARIEGREARRTSFSVVPTPTPPLS